MNPNEWNPARPDAAVPGVYAGHPPWASDAERSWACDVCIVHLWRGLSPGEVAKAVAYLERGGATCGS